jgi:uncharacterized protein HemX
MAHKMSQARYRRYKDLKERYMSGAEVECPTERDAQLYAMRYSRHPTRRRLYRRKRKNPSAGKMILPLLLGAAAVGVAWWYVKKQQKPALQPLTQQEVQDWQQIQSVLSNPFGY